MTYYANVYNVLIASPGDVNEERRLIIETIHEWNSLHSISRGVVLMPLMWESHSAPAFMVRPQETINQEVVDSCDIAIGVFWSKLGSPTGLSESGTIEEIERMSMRGKPIMLYFSRRDLPYDHDSESVRQVKEFKAKLMASCLISEYSSLDELKKQLIKHITIKSKSFKSVQEEVNNKTIVMTNTTEDGQRIVKMAIRDGSDKESLQLEEWRITTLQYLFNHTNSVQCTVGEMSRSFKLKAQAVQYYLDGLESDGFIECYRSYEADQPSYHLTKEGRAFLIKNRHIKI